MQFAVILFFAVVFSLSSMYYIYTYRGNIRYTCWTEYLRKGWPIFAPMNCLLYLFSNKQVKQPIIDTLSFKELDELRDNWEVIRDEALALQQQGDLETINQPGSDAYYDVGFRTFHKYGWRKFYLKWYGYTHTSAHNMCPKTTEILSRVKNINGAMFAYMPANSELTRHLDPVACSLRYHLGLQTPNSENCFINVDGQEYAWQDGKDLLFDETYLHFVKNNTEESRLILMCDFDRPVNFFGKVINSCYKILMKASLVPNTADDRSGIANKMFKTVTPMLQRSKELKKTNRKAYKRLKYTVNTLLLLIIFGVIAGVIEFFSWLFF
ncbi:aspartyl/asparaginyl beta-hydroxylase domain-containing protein [Marinomonas sp. TW1]|uniref:aspartyl/asparaginyl beta-hydroxylase domain-containing protein n=1 Tax=Marinomonas sp. TW1 TaxID=1561203 RepID=UPI0007AFA19E|nr:aspartyl/asparaginyl beta-hydroxylase domain-containing protein [Marinomonas sp. TW1]KZN14208.1 dioxygenase [Marinomonas sp. TW1]